MEKPRLAITMGDPTGIGPEVIAGAWQTGRLHACCRPLVLGHPAVLERAVALCQAPVQVMEVSNSTSWDSTPEVMPCRRVCREDAAQAPPGQVDSRGGQAAYDALIAAIDLAQQGAVAGLVTAPLHKGALWQAGHHYPGHTELLAERCGVADYAMMLYLSQEAGGEAFAVGQAGLHGGWGVIHVTLHTALRDVFGKLTTAAVLEKIRLADRALSAVRGSPARLGVCALNPHGGESGLFGDEEGTIILPAVDMAQRMGVNVSGPWPADALMVRARDGDFDGVVAMYHDQGHIALKLLGMHRAVNVTLGLPIVRTSVAHGTAHDVAWRGVADCGSMIEAVRVAARLVAAGDQFVRAGVDRDRAAPVVDGPLG